MTHPFHPWHGQRLEWVDCQRRWGQWRVYYVDENGQAAYLPASWTDIGPADPFVEAAQGKAIARLEDLRCLVEVIQQIKSRPVNENKPQV